MKSEFDNEIDWLLRAQARRSGAVREATDTQLASPHLDADTLSLYAEKALPPHALASYTEHLIACDACRASLAIYARMVASEADTAPPLVTAANDVAATIEPERAAWWTKFAVPLSSPRHLAYALPVLALFLIGITVFLITAPQRRETTLDVTDATQPAASSGNMAMNANMSAQPPPDSMGESATAGMMNSNAEADATTGTSILAQQRSAEAAGVKSNEPSIQQRAVPTLPQGDEIASAGVVAGSSLRLESQLNANLAELPLNSRMVVAPAMPPPPVIARQQAAAKSKNENSSNDLIVDAEDVEKVVTNTPPVASAAANRNISPATVPTQTEESSTLQMSPAPRTRSRTGNARRSDAGERREAQATEAATRVIGNRRFVRRGSFWVDESYREGTGVTGVRRGSARFRALLADEPGLRQIAETLPGTIIVVWNSRAYRIH